MLLGLSKQHLRRADNLEHFLTNRAKGMPEATQRECYQKLLSKFAAHNQTFQICEPVNQYGVGLVEIALESQLENFNKQNPGFPRIVKLVNVEVAGKQFVLILFYSSYGFQENLDLKLETLKLAVKHYNPKIFMEIVKGFIGSYAETFGDRFVYVQKPYQLLSNFNLYKYNQKAKKDATSKINGHAKAEEEKAKKEGKTFDKDAYLATETLKFERKNLFKKADFNIIEKIQFFPNQEQSRFLKQVVITILSLHSNKDYYAKMTKEQYLKEEFPISKRFTYQELKTQFAGIESALSLREPTGFQSFSAWFKSIFGGSKIYKWDELLQVLASDGNEGADYINSTIGNILSVSADIKYEPVELTVEIPKKVEEKKVQQKKVVIEKKEDEIETDDEDVKEKTTKTKEVKKTKKTALLKSEN